MNHDIEQALKYLLKQQDDHNLKMKQLHKAMLLINDDIQVLYKKEEGIRQLLTDMLTNK